MKARWLTLVGIAIALVGCSGVARPTASMDVDGFATSAASSSIPEAIVGAWVTTITEDDLRAGGVTGAGELGENTGTTTLTILADGTWSTSQESDVPLRWPVFKGTLEATGPNAFRQTTTFPADYAGDVVDFTWSIEGDALVLRVVNPPDHILPILMETHPWQPKG